MAKSLIECKKEEMEQMIKIPARLDEDPPPPVKPDTTDIETPQGPAPIKPNLEDTPKGPSPEHQPQRQPQHIKNKAINLCVHNKEIKI